MPFKELTYHPRGRNAPRIMFDSCGKCGKKFEDEEKMMVRFTKYRRRDCNSKKTGKVVEYLCLRCYDELFTDLPY